MLHDTSLCVLNRQHLAFREVLLDDLNLNVDLLSVDDGLNLIDDLGVNVLLDDGLSANDSAHVSRSGLDDVLDNVADDGLLNFTVNNRLNLDDLVCAHGFLNDRSTVNILVRKSVCLEYITL